SRRAAASGEASRADAGGAGGPRPAPPVARAARRARARPAGGPARRRRRRPLLLVPDAGPRLRRRPSPPAGRLRRAAPRRETALRPRGAFAELMERELIDDCVHCGFCLPHCPTYQSWAEEMDSPRGRIDLMRGVREKKIQLTDAVVGHFDKCLGCMACVTACPSGVKYDVLSEETG